MQADVDRCEDASEGMLDVKGITWHWGEQPSADSVPFVTAPVARHWKGCAGPGAVTVPGAVREALGDVV